MTTPVPPAATPANSVAPSASGAPAANAANATAGLTTSTTIASLADLKKKAPAVYNQMMVGIGLEICNEMKAHQDRLKQLMRQGEQNS